LNWANHSP